MKKLLLVLLSLFTQSVYAGAGHHAIDISSHRIGVPFYYQKTSYFSGYGFGYDYRFTPRRIGWVDYYAKLSLGTYRQRYYQNAIYTSGSFAIGRQTHLGVEFFMSLGAGYLRSFDDAAVYDQNSDGQYEQVRDYGHGSLIIPLTFELGYQFTQRYVVDALFLRYRMDFETPFAPENNIPLMGHEYLTVGVRF